MSDITLSAAALLDRLAREEQQLKHLGLMAQAAGVRVAITALIRLTAEAREHADGNAGQGLPAG